MATLYVTEYSGVAFAQIGGNYVAVPQEPPVADQAVSIPGTSAAFNVQTILVRLHTDAICSRLFGGSASTSNGRMAANQTEYHGVRAGSGLTVTVVANT
jgi:hypothetical protein